MHGSSFFIGFATIVGFAVVFDFGLLYLFKNNRSMFKSLFDHIRKGRPFSWIGGFAEIQVARVKSANENESLMQYRGLVQKRINDFKSPEDYEYMCDYLAMTGIISGLYCVLWLLIVPWSVEYGNAVENLYLTLSTSTLVAIIIVLIDVFCTKDNKNKKKPTRTAFFLYSTVIYIICCFVGWLMLHLGFVFTIGWPFHKLFLLSLLLSFSPICVYFVHLIVAFLHRLRKSIVLAIMALRLRNMKNKV